MRGAPAQVGRLALAAALWALCVSGCATWQWPRIDPSGERIFLPPQSAVVPANPIVPGLPVAQENITITPGRVIAPVGSEVVMQAGLCAPDRNLMPGQRVEWLLDPAGVGQIVAVGEKGCCLNPLNWFHPTYKADNGYAVAYTARQTLTITRGTIDPTDDVSILPGQSWATFTSPTEGTTKVTAYASAVRSWDRRKATAMIHWVDAQWIFPPPAINPVGSRHVFTTAVQRHTTGTPLEGYLVRYEILGGPPAAFAPGNADTVEVPTDQLGQASVEIFQTTHQPGVSRIGIQIIRPPVPGDNTRLVLGTGTTTKTWTSTETAPPLTLRTTGPGQAAVGAAATYRIEVTNPGDAQVSGVLVSHQLPQNGQGLNFVGANPQPQTTGPTLQWRLGDLGPQQTAAIEVHYRADRPGTANVCAAVQSTDGQAAQDCATTVFTAPVLEVRLVGPQQAIVGETVRFQATIANRGTAAATGLLIRDAYDAGLRHKVAVSPIERDLEDIAPGESRSIALTFTVVQAGQLCHELSVLSQGNVLGTARACVVASAAAVVPPTQGPATQPPGEAPQTQPPTQTPSTQPPAEPERHPAMEVEKRGPQQLAVGETAEFYMTVTNTGNVALTHVSVSDSYELALEPLEASGGYTVGRDALVWERAQLAPGDSWKLRVNCKCLTPAQKACNRMTVTSDQTPPMADDACVAIVPAADEGPAKVKPQPPVQPPQEGPKTQPQQQPQASKLTLAISDLADPVRAGEKETYKIFVTNPGKASDFDVAVVVTMPEGATLEKTTARVKQTQSGRTLRFEPVAELAPGEPLTYTITVLVNQAGTAHLEAELTSRLLPAAIKQQESTEVLPAQP